MVLVLGIVNGHWSISKPRVETKRLNKRRKLKLKTKPVNNIKSLFIKII